MAPSSSIIITTRTSVVEQERLGSLRGEGFKPLHLICLGPHGKVEAVCSGASCRTPLGKASRRAGEVLAV